MGWDASTVRNIAAVIARALWGMIAGRGSSTALSRLPAGDGLVRAPGP